MISLSSPKQEGPSFDPAMEPKEGGARLGAVEMAAPIYLKPDRRSPKIGYLRAGAIVDRAELSAGTEGCAGGWYRIVPRGYVCVGKGASLYFSIGQPPTLQNTA